MPTIIPFPAALCISQMTVHLQAHTSRFESPFRRGVQTQELPGGRFMLSASLAPTNDLTRTLRAFIAKLRGGAGRFYWPVEVGARFIPAAGAADITLSPLTVDNDRITVNRTDYRADATTWYATTRALALLGGTSRTIRASTNQPVGAVAVEAGRHLSFDTADGWRQLCVVTDDAIAGADQSVTINVEPPLRTQPAAGAPLHLLSPSGVFQLADDDQGQISQVPGYAQGATIEAFEAFPLRLTP